MVVLRGTRVLLRPGCSEDADRLVRIRTEPEVAQQQGNVDIEEKISEGSWRQTAPSPTIGGK